MSQQTRRVLISCGVLLAAACLCLGALSALGAGLAIYSQRTGSSVNQAPAPTPLVGKPFATPTPCAGACPTAMPSSNVPPDVAAQMDEIQAQVESFRGLKPSSPVNRALLTPEQLRERVINDFLAQYTPEEMAADQTVLTAFGLLPANFDLLTFFEDLYSEQIAGYYDNEMKEMYVVQGEGFQGPERMTYAHEYTHTLQDQVFDIRNGLNYSDEACQQDSERCAAVQSLIEGDASLAEQYWLTEYATEADMQDIQKFYGDMNLPVYNSAPEFFKEDFVFAYVQGLEFVQTLYDAGGWGAVNEAYANLPVSTEQILHPDRYPTDTPKNVELPDLARALNLGDGWSEVDRDAMGEWYTYLLLAKGEDENARLDEAAARKAAEGWGGDQYVVYAKAGSAPILVLKTTWDSEEDASQFEQAFSDYGSKRWGQSSQTGDITAWETQAGAALFSRSGTTTLWIQAPSMDAAQIVMRLSR